jgi:hypothetical protein
MSFSPDDPNFLTVLKEKDDKTRSMIFPIEQCNVKPQSSTLQGYLTNKKKSWTGILYTGMGVRSENDKGPRFKGGLGSLSDYYPGTTFSRFTPYTSTRFNLTPYAEGVRIVYKDDYFKVNQEFEKKCVDTTNKIQEAATLKESGALVDIKNMLSDARKRIYGAIDPANDLTRLNTCSNTHEFNGKIRKEDIPQKFKIIPIDDEKFQIQLPNDGNYPLCLERVRTKQYYTLDSGGVTLDLNTLGLPKNIEIPDSWIPDVQAKHIGADIATTECDINNPNQQWRFYKEMVGEDSDIYKFDIVNPEKIVEIIDAEPLMGFRDSGSNMYCTYNLDKFKTYEDMSDFRSRISTDTQYVNRVASKVCIRHNDSLKNTDCVKYYTDAKPLKSAELENIEPQCLLVPVFPGRGTGTNATGTTGTGATGTTIDPDITKRGLFQHGACINYYTQKIKSKTLTEEEKQSLVDRCKQLEDPTSAEICRLVCKENEVCGHLTDYCRINLEKCGDLTFAGKLHEKVLYTACAHADFVDPTPLPIPGQIKIIIYDKSDNSTEYTTFTKNEAEGIKYIIFDLGKNIEIKRMEFQTSVSLYDKVVNILDSLNPNLPSKKTFRIEKGFYDLYDSLLYTFPQTVLGRYIRIDIQRPHNKNIFQDTCGQFVNLTKVNGLIENRLNATIVKECKHMREQNMGNPKDFPECSCFLPDAEREKLADAIKNKSRGEVKETRLGCIFEPCVMQEAYKNQSTNCPPITVCTNDVSITNYGSIEGDLTVRGTNDCGSADGTNISLQNVDCVASAWSDCRYVLDTSGKPIDGFQTRNVILPKEGEGTNCGPLERKCPEFAPKDDDMSKSNPDASAGLMTVKNGVLFGIVVVLVVGGYFVWASMKPKTENKN